MIEFVSCGRTEWEELGKDWRLKDGKNWNYGE